MAIASEVTVSLSSQIHFSCIINPNFVEALQGFEEQNIFFWRCVGIMDFVIKVFMQK